MKASIVKIGNSRGVRIPKHLLDEVGFYDNVEIVAKDGEIHIKKVNTQKPTPHQVEVVNITQQLIKRHQKALDNLSQR